MLKNYLKIALKVLLRRKFFTFISLFGISFTIMFLIIISSETESLVAPLSPEINLDRSLFIKRIRVEGSGWRESNPSYYFLEKCVRTLKTPEKTSFYMDGGITSKYRNNRKMDIPVKYTDSYFWEILKFNFIEGRPYRKAEVDNAEYVAVISEKLRNDLFGEISVIGKNLLLENKSFRIIGVVKDVLKGRMPYADIWVPVSLSGNDYKHPDFTAFEALILAKEKSQLQSIKNEFYTKLRYTDMSNFGIRNVKRIICPVKSHEEALESGKILGVDVIKRSRWLKAENNSWLTFRNTTLLFICFFILLPLLNLININLTRIYERAPEIGIRKSFGATTTALTGQFIVENLLLTFAGGIAGFILAAISISLLNHSEFFDNSLIINYNVAIYAILLNLIFGLLTGVYPAYKMSCLDPVNSLRGGLK